MITHRHKQVKEKSTSALHLHLHRSAALERSAAANDKSQIVCSQLAVRVRRIGVGVACGCQNGATLDARLEPLLAEGEPLQLVKAIFFRCAAGAGVKIGTVIWE